MDERGAGVREGTAAGGVPRAGCRQDDARPGAEKGSLFTTYWPESTLSS